MDIETAMIMHDGVARTRDLLASGVTPTQIVTAWSTGAIDRVRKGVYALDRRTPAAIAAAHGGAVACLSALHSAGVWILAAPDELHVAVGRNGRVHQHEDCSCIDHHDGPDTHLGTVSVLQALIQATRCADELTLFAAFESAWRLGLLTRAERRQLMDAVDTSARDLFVHAQGDADSGLESIFRLLINRAGLFPQSQVYIDGIGRVDFLLGRTIIELDGRLNHEGQSERHRDLLRDAAAARLGYRVLRFDYAMVVYDWPSVLASVRAAIA